MAVLDLIATARDDTFAARVAMTLATMAVTITSEAPTTANHANRLILATKVIKAQVNNKAIAMIVIAGNPTIQAAIVGAPQLLGSNVPDGDMAYELAVILDAIANAYAND